MNRLHYPLDLCGQTDFAGDSKRPRPPGLQHDGRMLHHAVLASAHQPGQNSAMRTTLDSDNDVLAAV